MDASYQHKSSNCTVKTIHEHGSRKKTTKIWFLYVSTFCDFSHYLLHHLSPAALLQFPFVWYSTTDRRFWISYGSALALLGIFLVVHCRVMGRVLSGLPDFATTVGWSSVLSQIAWISYYVGSLPAFHSVVHGPLAPEKEFYTKTYDSSEGLGNHKAAIGDKMI